MKHSYAQKRIAGIEPHAPVEHHKPIPGFACKGQGEAECTVGRSQIRADIQSPPIGSATSSIFSRSLSYSITWPRGIVLTVRWVNLIDQGARVSPIHVLSAEILPVPSGQRPPV